jgi:hypothetical protein
VNPIDCYDYIRRTYHMPAYIGVRVTVRGLAGTLMPATHDLHYLHVLFDGRMSTVTAHPTDDVQYHVIGAGV